MGDREVGHDLGEEDDRRERPRFHDEHDAQRVVGAPKGDRRTVEAATLSQKVQREIGREIGKREARESARA